MGWRNQGRMQRLFLHTSNRLEVLADGLAEVLRRPLASPFTPEVIVVPSLGMARWLKLELARRLGVWANGNFPSPEGFAQDFFAQALPGTPKTTPFRREVLTWALMDLLPGIQAVEHYLRADDPDLLAWVPEQRGALTGKVAALG